MHWSRAYSSRICRHSFSHRFRTLVHTSCGACRCVRHHLVAATLSMRHARVCRHRHYSAQTHRSASVGPALLLGLLAAVTLSAVETELLLPSLDLLSVCMLRTQVRLRVVQLTDLTNNRLINYLSVSLIDLAANEEISSYARATGGRASLLRWSRLHRCLMQCGSFCVRFVQAAWT